MKNKRKKIFDSVQITREIREVMFRRTTDLNFDPKEFTKLKEKWSILLEEQKEIIAKDFKVI